MKLKLLDYSDKEVEFEIGELEDIDSIIIQVISGDEIAHVFYKDGHSDNFDSGVDRLMDFDDGSYIIYDADTGINYMTNPKWVGRSSSYDAPENLNDE